MDIKKEQIEFSPSTHAECVFNTHTYILMIDTKIPIDVDNYFKIPPEALTLKDYILHCQDRKVFCEVSKELIDYAIGYGTIRLSKLPKNEKFVKDVRHLFDTIFIDTTKEEIEEDLRRILKENE